ncbi:MAG TPA: hypothetical protein VFL86_04330 [Burkholderiaceae bacterium]|nr:hypothetical protein [Burkholderiaceae bacterium]
MNLLNDTLIRMTVDELMSIRGCLPGMPKSGPKLALQEFLRQRLSGTGLKTTWQMLDDSQRLAVAEAVHEPLGRFSEQLFVAKHGRSPRFFNPPPEGSRLSSWDR